MEKNIKIIVTVLLVSVILNVFSISQLFDLRQEVREQTFEYHNLVNQFHSSLADVQFELSEMNEANNWISEVTFKPIEEASQSNQVILSAEWTVKELESDSAITLSYKPINEANWVEVEAKKKTSTTYEASLALDSEKDYEYHISSIGNMQRGTEVMEIPSHFYKRIVSYNAEFGDNGRGQLTSYEIWLDQHQAPFSFFKVKEARLIVTTEDGAVKEEKLLKRYDPNGYWNVKIEAEKIQQIELEVEFEDGLKKKREVYPNEEWLDDKSW